MRNTKRLFYRTDYSLLRTPAFLAHFDSTKFGGMYRLLASRVYRVEEDDILYKNEKGFITELAKRYSAGHLCAYFTVEDLMNALGLKDKRHVYNIRNKLKDAKLIKFKKFGNGDVYQLGVRIQHEDDEGYGVGAEHEAFYLDKWITMAESDPYELTVLILEIFGTEAEKERFKTQDCEKYFAAVRKIFRKNDQEKSSEKNEQNEEKVVSEVTPIEDNSNRNTNVSSEKPAIQVTSEIPKMHPKRKILMELEKETDFAKANRIGRQAISENLLPKKLVDTKLLEKVEGNSRYEGLPRFSQSLAVLPDRKYGKEKKIVTLYTAIVEDLTGKTFTNYEFQTLTGMIKAVDGKHPMPYEQYAWTLIKVSQNRATMDFIAKAIQNFIKVVKEWHTRYRAFVEEVQQIEADRVAQEALLKKALEANKPEENKEKAEINPLLAAKMKNFRRNEE